MREALALWRGSPLADLGDVPVLAADVERLHEHYLTAYEECADVELDLGRHVEIIGELAGLVGEHPLRERLRARLMLALYRAGRQAEALAAYDEGRRVLADEVGVDPGRELREPHSDMLRARPELDPRPVAPGLPVPRQLPGDIADFTGRTAALDHLDEMTHGGERVHVPVLITAIAGTPGVGKTALAVHWAYRTAARFPDARRAEAERDAAAALCELCAHLPLAVRIAVAALLDQPDRAIASYVRELSGNRLAALEVEDDEETAVRAAFDLSYTRLPDDARRLFRLLGLVPGGDVDVAAAAALAGTTPHRVWELLARLVRANLVDADLDSRHTFHDLLRLYARERAEKEDSPADRQAAVQRLYRYYLHTADARLRDRHEEALSRLPEALRLARRIGYGIGAVRALIGFADIHRDLARFDQAESYATEAHATAERSGYRVLTGRSLTLLARVHLARARFDEALSTAHEALKCHQDTGCRLGEAHTLLVLADAAQQTGGPDEGHRQRALDLLADIGAP